MFCLGAAQPQFGQSLSHHERWSTPHLGCKVGDHTLWDKIGGGGGGGGGEVTTRAHRIASHCVNQRSVNQEMAPYCW
jgi:hypothetical protein